MTSVMTTFVVQPQDYDSLQLSWSLPTGTWNEQVLLRSSFGTPLSCFGSIGDVGSIDGIVLLDQFTQATPPPPPFSISFTDTGLQSGRFYYYSLFVSTSPGEYVLAGSCQGLVLTQFGFGDFLYNWLPAWYQVQDEQLGTDEQPLGPFQRFLNLLGYEQDWMYSEITSLFLFTDPALISGAMLPYLGANLGMNYEPQLGMQRSRALIENAVYLYQNKGTTAGIAAAASAYTGYGCEVTIGANLEIQLDSYAFDRSVGQWVPGNAASSITTGKASTYGVTPPHTTYEPAAALEGIVSTEGYLPVNNENVGVATASGDILWLTTCNSATAQTLGIPIPQQATPPTYVVSMYLHPSTLATPSPYKSFFMQIDWYAENGALLSSTEGVSVAETEWGWIRPYVAGTPPAGAYWFGRTLKSTSVLTSTVRLLDALQTEVNSLATPTACQPPRDIKVNLIPNRQNLVANPVGGAGNIASWSVTNGGMVASSSSLIDWPVDTTSGFIVTAEPTFDVIDGGAEYGASIPSTAFFGGGAYAGGSEYSSNITISTIVPVNGGAVYTFSSYVQAAQATGALVYWFVSFYSALGQFVPAIEPFSELAGLSPLVGSWQQGSVIDTIAPDNAATALLQCQITGANTGQQFYLGAFLFEHVPYIAPFFDGSSMPSTDYFWEGTPNDSISDYYFDLSTRLSRLVTVLPEYVPLGATFSLQTGAQTFAAMGESG